MKQVNVAGGGAFGTALAISLASDGRPVGLWARDPAHVADMVAARENRSKLANRRFPDSLSVTSTLSEFAPKNILLVAVPTQSLRSFLETNRAAISDQHLVLCCKGIEKSTGLLPTQVVESIHPGHPTSVLTGPGFASEISAGLPTALTLAATQDGDALQENLSAGNLRLYLSGDPNGAQLGGALKNVVAIACGLTIGAGLGESARASVMTRGFAEMSRLARAMGAKTETLMGLSGLGDLALTCTSAQSRNFALGYALGQGGGQQQGVTYEGAATAEATHTLAASLNVEMPLTEIVIAILTGQRTIEQAVGDLLRRRLRQEQE